MIDFFAGTKADSRPYQQRICQTVASMIDGTYVSRHNQQLPPAKSVMIESPCGTGKTLIGLAIAKHLTQEYGARGGWVAMRHNLLKQAKDMHDAFGFDIPDMKYISMFDPNPPTDVDYLIEDEAHHANCNSMANIYSAIQPTWSVGLTATPFRTDHSQLAFERVVKDIGINTCIQEGWLSQYDHYTIQRYTPAAITELFRTDADRWGKSVVFFFTMDKCQELSQRLTNIGIKNELVWGGSDRQAQIEAFDEGKVKVLISMSLLAEGFNSVDMRTVFVRPSSKLPTVQQAGRVLRKCDTIPLKQIVQCQDTRYPFVKIARPHGQFVEVDHKFMSLHQNDNVQRFSQVMAQQVLQAKVVVPPFVKKHKIRKLRHRINRDYQTSHSRLHRGPT